MLTIREVGASHCLYCFIPELAEAATTAGYPAVIQARSHKTSRPSFGLALYGKISRCAKCNVAEKSISYWKSNLSSPSNRNHMKHQLRLAGPPTHNRYRIFAHKKPSEDHRLGVAHPPAPLPGRLWPGILLGLD